MEKKKKASSAKAPEQTMHTREKKLVSLPDLNKAM